MFKNLLSCLQEKHTLKSIFYYIYGASKDQIELISSKNNKHYCEKDPMEMFKEIPTAYFSISELSSVKNKKIVKNDADGKIFKNFHKTVFEGIALIEDVKFRDKFFDWLMFFLKNHGLGSIVDEDVKKAISNLYEQKNIEPLIFLRKKFPKVNISDTELFLNLFQKKVEAILPPYRIKLFNSMLNEYRIEKLDIKNISKNSSTLISSLLRGVDTMPSNFPKMIKKAIQMGDRITINDIGKIGEMTYGDERNQILMKLEDIFFDFFSKEENGLSNIEGLEIENIMSFLASYDEKAQEKLVFIIFSDKTQDTSTIAADILLKLTLRNSFCPVYRYKKPNIQCTKVNYREKTPFFFAVLKHYFYDSDGCIEFLQNNDIDYYAINEHNEDIIKYLENTMYPFEEDSDFYKKLSKIKSFCEIEQLNQSSAEEFNL